MPQQPTKLGLMLPPSQEATPLYNELIAPLFKLTPARSIEQQLKGLTEANRNTVLMLVRHGKMLSQMASFGADLSSYRELLQQAYPQLRSDLLALAVQILEKAAPLPDKDKPKQTQRTPREQAMEELYGPTLEVPTQPQPQPQPQPKQAPAFLDRLTASESSGKSDAEITIADGRRFVGKLQFGTARLQDYQRATGAVFSQDEFKADNALQDKVAEWHLADIDKAIASLGDAATQYNSDGLRAVAHLGGITGMRRYVQSAGTYNPSDELGTSLQDYYERFSGGST